jgi:hypothetical protein
MLEHFVKPPQHSLGIRLDAVNKKMIPQPETLPRNAVHGPATARSRSQ